MANRADRHVDRVDLQLAPGRGGGASGCCDPVRATVAGFAGARDVPVARPVEVDRLDPGRLRAGERRWSYPAKDLAEHRCPLVSVEADAGDESHRPHAEPADVIRQRVAVATRLRHQECRCRG